MDDELREALAGFYGQMHGAVGEPRQGQNLCGPKRAKYSDALSVHPKQVQEAIARDRKHGVPTDYLPDGRPVITSRAHQKKLVKSLGFYNKDGGFGD